MAQRTLTDLELRIIDFAAKHDVNRLETSSVAPLLAAEFGWRPVTFVQRVLALLDDPAAERERPMEVKRLRRLREDRRVARSQPFVRRLESAG
jgi:hypothetical protein